MTKLWSVVAGGALVASGCCFGGTEDAPTSIAAAESTPAAATAPSAPAQVTTSIALAPGFSPDPQTFTGMAGGSVDADTLQTDCRGYVASASQPTYTLELAGAFSQLVLSVSAARDTTMLVQGPDGGWRCNDDFVGLGAGVAGPFAAGTHRVWIGTYSPTTGGAPYTLTVGTTPPPGARMP